MGGAGDRPKRLSVRSRWCRAWRPACWRDRGRRRERWRRQGARRGRSHAVRKALMRATEPRPGRAVSVAIRSRDARRTRDRVGEAPPMASVSREFVEVSGREASRPLMTRSVSERVNGRGVARRDRLQSSRPPGPVRRSAWRERGTRDEVQRGSVWERPCITRACN